jgi:hypothetical protein
MVNTSQLAKRRADLQAKRLTRGFDVSIVGLLAESLSKVERLVMISLNSAFASLTRSTSQLRSVLMGSAWSDARLMRIPDGPCCDNFWTHLTPMGRFLEHKCGNCNTQYMKRNFFDPTVNDYSSRNFESEHSRQERLRHENAVYRNNK